MYFDTYIPRVVVVVVVVDGSCRRRKCLRSSSVCGGKRKEGRGRCGKVERNRTAGGQEKDRMIEGRQGGRWERIGGGK